MKLFGRRATRPFEVEPAAEIEGEIEFHLEQRVREYVARGMSEEAARAAALQRLGDLRQIREECTDILEAERRDADRRNWLADITQDVRFGVRSLRKAPLFAIVAVLTLALGIGANAAVFTVVKSALLDGLPYAAPERLVRIYARLQDGTLERTSMSAGALQDISARTRSFEQLAAFYHAVLDVAYNADSGPRVLTAAVVGPGFLQTLGTRMQLGRPITDADARTGAPFVAILSYEAWQREFGADPAVVGRFVILGGDKTEIIGVLPRNFAGPMGRADVLFPLDLTPALRDPVRSRKSHWLGVVGRLRPHVDVATAQRELTQLAADLAREHPDSDGGHTFTAVPVRDAMLGDTRTPLRVLMASAALVLLITCANLAGALLSRTISRRKEFAVRVALGAGRGRLVRQLLTESVILSATGGAIGLALAYAGLRALRSAAAHALPAYASLALDPIVIAVTVIVTFATGVAFGLTPAFAVGRTNVQGTLRDETRGSSEGRGARRMRGVLVAGQIALCISLLVGAGLLARSLWKMASAPLGFGSASVLTFKLQLPSRDYDSPAAIRQFYNELEQRLRALPGVTSVASASELPAPSMNRNGLAIEGVTWPQNAQPFIAYVSASDDYFRTMQIPLREGRLFGASEREHGPVGIVVSEGMARRYWPKGNAIGARIRLGPETEQAWAQVIGIVGDVRNDPAAPQPEPMAYASARQDAWSSRHVLVRTSGDPHMLVRAAQREVAALDSQIPLRDVKTLDEAVDALLTARKLPVILMSGFGVLALILASVGVYALFASMAAARQREFSVRIALGSTPRAIAALVVRQGGVWMLAGLAAGALGVALIGRLVQRMLVDVQPFDPAVLGVSVVLLILCATGALLVPVRRATRADPVNLLR